MVFRRLSGHPDLRASGREPAGHPGSEPGGPAGVSANAGARLHSVRHQGRPGRGQARPTSAGSDDGIGRDAAPGRPAAGSSEQFRGATGGRARQPWPWSSLHPFLDRDEGDRGPTTLLPDDAPEGAQVDPDGFAFSGHFKIGRQLEDGSWRVVSPVGSLMALWKDRAAIWLLGTVLSSIPLAYLLASGVLAPLRRFGAAAERLGRNLREPPLDLDGPAEIAGAAKAFNEMASRLSRFVDDRVAMMGAVAHAISARR